jgi:hypothetical protein
MRDQTIRATLGLLAAAVLLSATAARADFDIDLKADLKYAPGLRVEKPTKGRNFSNDRAASYIRFLPPVGKKRAYPAFISTHNYLTCPDSDKKIYLGEVKQVDINRRNGIKVLGFFFDSPGCDSPTFHMEPILAD